MKTSLVVLLAAGALAMVQHLVGDLCHSCVIEAGGVGDVAHHHGDGGRDLAVPAGGQECCQIGAAAGEQDGDAVLVGLGQR